MGGSRRQRRPRKVRFSCRVAVGISIANSRNRTPEVVMVLGIPTPNQGVGNRHVGLRKEPGTIGDRQTVCQSYVANVPVDLGTGIFHIEPADSSLLRRANRIV